MKKKRPPFIPEIRDMIAKQCPMPREEVMAAIDRWESGWKHRTPQEAGVFGVCDKVRQDIDRTQGTSEAQR